MDSVSRVAVVEDDPEISRMMTNYMTDHGFEVTAARNGRDLDRVMSGGKIDCVILDVGLPGEDGLSICRRLRGKSTVPIIMVTGRDSDTDRIVGLELGADDYLPKPFNPRELVARIHAVLRRRTELLAPGGPAADGRIVFGPYLLDLSTRTLLRGETPIPLTTGEFGLLKVLATHPRRPLAREQLMLLARGRDHDVFDRAIDVQISRLRKLVEPDPSTPRFIQTVWGFGYVFVPDEASASDGAGA